uniref:Protein abrupt-like isoform X1 n=1 Tax=Diabrotica virgifera virgifera TaxID=50390 RepID=A0A6P7FE28_DIAVI
MATTEQFSLRWNNFHSNMTSGFHDLLESAEMVDVTLAVDGHFLQAHKIVLSICSPYFKQMFKANPCKHPIVILKDVRHENMKDILEFMYMGEVSVLRENLTQFLRTAELLQVKGLTGDDPGEDGSSSKDNKAECDNDEENEIYNELIETDVELPSYSHSSPTPMVPSPAMTKRTKNLSNAGVSGKRSKIENQQSPIKSSDFEPVQPKCELNTSQLQPTNDNSNILNAVKPELDDIKEPINLKTWDNHLNTSSGSDYLNSSAEQDLMSYSTDSKCQVFCPYCSRKFVNRYNLKVHVRDKHEASFKDLDCQICGKTMRNQSCLRVHMYHHRKQNLDTSSGVLNTSSLGDV